MANRSCEQEIPISSIESNSNNPLAGNRHETKSVRWQSLWKMLDRVRKMSLIFLLLILFLECVNFFSLTTILTSQIFTRKATATHSEKILDKSVKTHPETIDIINHRPWANRTASMCDALNEATLNGSTAAIQKEKRVIYLRDSCVDRTIGNVLMRFYSGMMLAESAGASFFYQCRGHSTQKHLRGERTILSLLQDLYETPRAELHNLIDKDLVPPLTQICQAEDQGQANLDALTDVVRYDFHKMIKTAIPPVPKSEVAIHYRCGDALNSSNSQYGILPHETFTTLISQQYDSNDQVKTISIVTQPYDRKHLRARDKDYGARCKVIVEDFVSVLKKTYPSSSVNVYNNPETETVARTLFRLASATRVTICGASTFCVFPTIASPGMGYILDTRLFPWEKKNDIKTGGFQVYESPKLNGLNARKMNETELLTWVRGN